MTSPSSVDSKCAVNASVDPAKFAANGGSGKVAVSANRECQWSVSAGSGWIQLGNGNTGQGDGAVTFSVAANADPSVRQGALSVGGHQLSISQDAAICEFSLSPPSDTVSPAGERRTIRVTASSPLCTWTARSNEEWLRILEGGQGSGNGQMVYEAIPTSGPTRSGSLVVAGQTVPITQGTGCSTSISPASQTVGASGGGGTVSVTAGPGCAWSAQSEASWITITSGTSGTGPGTVGFAVGSWNGPTRTGTLRVDTHSFVVTQTAGCSFSITPESASVAATGGTGRVDVGTAGGCAWTAASNAPWLQITGGSSGAGPGAISYTALPNAGAPRSGTLTVAGRTFTVSQAAAACSYSINPSASPEIPALGGSGEFALATDGHCSWTATSTDSWVTITSARSGSGGATIRFTAAANTGGQRTGSITVGGRTFTVTQAAAGCSYGISPASETMGAGSRNSSFALTTAGHCTWTVQSNAPWITVTSPASGTGSATITFSVPNNDGPDRTGTIVVAGQTFTVTQTGGCRYSLSPATTNMASAGGTGTIRVETTNGCSWTATSPVGWVTITAGASGSGTGDVQISVAQNQGPARSTTLAIAGQTFTLTQDSGCTVSISPASQNVPAAGGSGTVTVTTGEGCGWTAAVDPAAPWITLGNTSGTGSGTVSFTVAANGGAARTGTVVIGGQTFTVTQDGVVP